MGGKWSNPPPNISIAFEGKTHSLTLLRLRHVEPYGFAFLTELFNLLVAGFEIPEIWKNSSIMMESLQGSVISPALDNHFVSACLITDAYMTSYAGDFALLALLCFQHRGRWGNGELTLYYLGEVGRW